MDKSSLIGGDVTSPGQKNVIEYTAQAASPIMDGEVKLTIGENSFTATALFDAAVIPFTEINALVFSDYIVTVKTDSGDFAFSRMGQWAQPFYDALCDAYNKAALRSLFIKSSPIITTRGDYGYTEENNAATGAAPFHVYEDSVAILPPDVSARRVPLCFVTGMEKGAYTLTLKLGAGESYTFAKLGYDTEPFADSIEKQIRAIREKTLVSVKDIDPNTTTVQASQIAKIMPQGAAAPFGQLMPIASSFVNALESELLKTRAAEFYTILKELCGPARIYIGFRKNENGAGGAGGAGGLTGSMSGMSAMLGGLMKEGNLMKSASGLTDAGMEGEDAQTPPAGPFLLWLIAPSPDEKFAVVEFAEADTATFVYKTYGGFNDFARQLNRALEAINFKREVISLPDDELKKQEYTNYYMAAKRTASLQFIRASFAGRIIHSTPEAWKRKLTDVWNGA